MASLCNDGGLRRILCNLPGRPAIRLGRISLKDAREIFGHVGHLETAKRGGTVVPPQTSLWLTTVGDTLRDRLVSLGLAAGKVEITTLTLTELVERFKDRPRWRARKPATHVNYEFAFRHILARFGSDRDVASVTDADAEDLIGYLTEAKAAKGAGLAKASAHRICETGSMLFRFAVRSRLILANPFDDVRRGTVASARRAFIDAETSRTVLDAMKDSQWRLLFGLARWGGLRVPSEPRELRWGDIDRENDKFRVTSPKTAHHDGGGERWVPLFPELIPLIDDRFADAEPGEFVLPMMRTLDRSAFRNQLDRTVRKLGLDRWPRIFHNLRATRQTELENLYPTFKVCAWLGNSPRIAAKHYLTVTPEDFKKAAQNAAQHSPETPGTMGNKTDDTPTIPDSSPQCPDSTTRDMKRLITERP